MKIFKHHNQVNYLISRRLNLYLWQPNVIWLLTDLWSTEISSAVLKLKFLSFMFQVKQLNSYTLLMHLFVQRLFLCSFNTIFNQKQCAHGNKSYLKNWPLKMKPCSSFVTWSQTLGVQGENSRIFFQFKLFWIFKSFFSPTALHHLYAIISFCCDCWRWFGDDSLWEQTHTLCCGLPELWVFANSESNNCRKLWLIFELRNLQRCSPGRTQSFIAPLSSVCTHLDSWALI